MGVVVKIKSQESKSVVELLREIMQDAEELKKELDYFEEAKLILLHGCTVH